MLKLLSFALLIVVALLLYRRNKEDHRAPAESVAPLSEEMVACQYCGLRVPASESIKDAGAYYCSDEHRRSDTR